jgi:predicted kinase
MSKKQTTTKSQLFLLYGLPGSGKTAFARQMTTHLQVVHVSPEKIRHELFRSPNYDQQEQIAVDHLVRYMTREFLAYGMNVMLDVSVNTFKARKTFSEMAAEFGAGTQLLWFQIDNESAKIRSLKRDHRKSDDKYSFPMDDESFESYAQGMQPPRNNEEYIVISGKHTFTTQRDTLMKRLQLLGLLDASPIRSSAAMPNLVNLVTGLGGRYDPERRISIR